jgi:Ca-activated chloride channel homolog
MTGRTAIATAMVSALAVLIWSPAPSAAPAPQDPPARFRSSVDVVSVAAVVRDRKGRFVSDLSRDDFVVVEAGQRRPILDFRAETDGPVKLALLMDVSGSMRVAGKAIDARKAADHVFAALAPDDEAAVFTFDSALRQVHPFSSNRGALMKALDSVEKPFGQTSLYDAVAETARAVAARGRTSTGLLHRSAVVVLTDGVDTKSRLTPEQVSHIASEIDVPVYLVAVMSPVDDPREREDERLKSGAAELEHLARRTGGELFFATAPAHASVAAREIVNELRHQYVLAFEASTRTGWRPLEVRARDDDLHVRARSGYTAGGQAFTP